MLKAAIDVNTRKYKDDDWDQIRRVYDAARYTELLKTLGIGAFESLKAIADEEQLFDAEIWVAEAQGTLVGFAATEDNRVDWLYVHPDFHGRGIGRRLLQEAVTRCGKNAQITVLAGNDAALHLYKSEGFEVVKEREGSMHGFNATFIDLCLAEQSKP